MRRLELPYKVHEAIWCVVLVCITWVHEDPPVLFIAILLALTLLTGEGRVARIQDALSGDALHANGIAAEKRGMDRAWEWEKPLELRGAC